MRTGRRTLVSMMLLRPSRPTERKTCPWDAALQASMATETVPSVEFLKPHGMESDEVSSRWTCDSVVRAPIAPQETRSAVYCIASQRDALDRRSGDGSAPAG